MRKLGIFISILALVLTVCSPPEDDFIDFSSTSITVTSVEVSPSTAIVAKGGTESFSAKVNGYFSYQVTWSIVETNKSAGTTIDSDGLLTVAADETLTALTIKAASTVDTSKSGTAAVTVVSPTVNSVGIYPSTANVTIGTTRKFTATVTGTNSPAQTVTWSIVQTGKSAGTTIDSDGLLTVAADEALTALTIKATSTVDTSKNGTVAVTVIDYIPSGITSDGFRYIGDKTGYKITGYTGSETIVYIPSYINEIPVIAIGDNAFSDKGLTQVALGSYNKLITIGEKAFANNNISGILSIPDSVTSIGNYAFQNNKITFLGPPSSSCTIGISAFANNSIKTLLTFGVDTIIGMFAFSNNQITSIKIQAVKDIGSYAFSDNPDLKEITMGQNKDYAQSIDNGFYVCYENNSRNYGTYVKDANGWRKQ
jgi:hypothetical protein